jgi:hypothetical protein
MSGNNIQPTRSREKSAGHSWEEGHVPCSAESHRLGLETSPAAVSRAGR